MRLEHFSRRSEMRTRRTGAWTKLAALHHRQLVNEVTTLRAFEGLRAAERGGADPTLPIAVADHNVLTEEAFQPDLGARS